MKREGNPGEIERTSKSGEGRMKPERTFKEVQQEEFYLLDLIGKVKNGTYSRPDGGAMIKDENGKVVYEAKDVAELDHLSRFYDSMGRARAVGEFAEEEERIKHGKRSIKISGSEENEGNEHDRAEAAELLPGEEGAYIKARMLVRGGGYIMDPKKDGSVMIKDEQGKAVFMSPNGRILEKRYRDVNEVKAYNRFRQAAVHGAYSMEETESEVVFKDKNNSVVFASNAPVWLDSIYEYVLKRRNSETSH